VPRNKKRLPGPRTQSYQRGAILGGKPETKTNGVKKAWYGMGGGNTRRRTHSSFHDNKERKIREKRHQGKATTRRRGSGCEREGTKVCGIQGNILEALSHRPRLMSKRERKERQRFGKLSHRSEHEKLKEKVFHSRRKKKRKKEFPRTGYDRTPRGRQESMGEGGSQKSSIDNTRVRVRKGSNAWGLGHESKRGKKGSGLNDRWVGERPFHVGRDVGKKEKRGE